jgi:hypothetical protein
MLNEDDDKKMQLEYRKHLCMMFQGIDDLFLSLEKVYLKLLERQEMKKGSNLKNVFTKIGKTFLFILTIITIVVTYYFYIYVFIY